jgi:hypothetical protein
MQLKYALILLAICKTTIFAQVGLIDPSYNAVDLIVLTFWVSDVSLR